MKRIKAIDENFNERKEQMKERENATPWIFCIGNFNVDAELVEERWRERNPLDTI